MRRFALSLLTAVLTVLLTLPVAGAEEFVLVVNKQNSVNTLSKREVIDIFMGRYQTFPNGNAAHPLDLAADSELKNQFYLELVNQDERKINAYWAKLLFSGRARPPEPVSSVSEALDKLQKSMSAIAYIPASSVTDNVKVVYRLDEN